MEIKYSTVPPYTEIEELFKLKYENKRFLTFPDRVVDMYEYIQQHHADSGMVNAALAARLKPSCMHINNLLVS